MKIGYILAFIGVLLLLITGQYINTMEDLRIAFLSSFGIGLWLLGMDNLCH